MIPISRERSRATARQRKALTAFQAERLSG